MFMMIDLINFCPTEVTGEEKYVVLYVILLHDWVTGAQCPITFSVISCINVFLNDSHLSSFTRIVDNHFSLSFY